MNTDWQKLATKTIKVELARADIGYEELVKRLSDIGVTESYTGIAAKINRGTFSFMFFVQCMKAINKNTITLD
jgi:DNA (cytosine-5)-methyltransferase 1